MLTSGALSLLVPHRGGGVALFQTTPEYTLMCSVSPANWRTWWTMIRTVHIKFTQNDFFSDVLDWVKSVTGSNDGCERDPDFIPPTPPAPVCEDTYCSSKCKSKNKCKKGGCKKFCKKHCNDNFSSGYTCNWMTNLKTCHRLTHWIKYCIYGYLMTK